LRERRFIDDVPRSRHGIFDRRNFLTERLRTGICDCLESGSVTFWNFPCPQILLHRLLCKPHIGGVFPIGATREGRAGQGGSEFVAKNGFIPNGACADPRIEVFQACLQCPMILMKNRPRLNRNPPHPPRPSAPWAHRFFARKTLATRDSLVGGTSQSSTGFLPLACLQHPYSAPNLVGTRSHA